MGFCACFQFGSGITWLSSNIPEMSSRQVSFIFLGSNCANCVFPALASKLFNDFGPNWVFYLTMISLMLTILCFMTMLVIASRYKREEHVERTNGVQEENEWKINNCRFLKSSSNWKNGLHYAKLFVGLEWALLTYLQWKKKNEKKKTSLKKSFCFQRYMHKEVLC